MAIRNHPVVGHLTSAPVPLRKVAVEEAPDGLADRRGGGLLAVRGAVDDLASLVDRSATAA